MNIKPLHDNVVIKPLKADEVTKSGIVLPETLNKEQPEKGEVLAVGPGRISPEGKLNVMAVQVGQKVLFKKYSADEVKLNNEELLVVSEKDIIAILD